MGTLVLLSGGLDSSTLLAHVLEQRSDAVEALSIDYGQRHHREMNSAAAVATHFGVRWEPFVLNPGSLFRGSSQTDPSVPVPKGRYDEPSMKKTVVPNRNMVLLSIAGAFAISRGLNQVAYGAHAGDHAIYPDCRPEFVRAMNQAFQLCDWNLLSLWTPFITFSKGEIVELGLSLKVPFEKTWTCYEGLDKACGTCGSCSERLEAFRENGVTDPIDYA